MIEKEFIPYEQALDLKELGFNEPCFGSYDPFGSKQLSCSGIYTYGNCIAAPLYQQAFSFFREKYKIRFIIQSSMSDLGEYFKVIFPNGEQRNVSYNTYKEAEQAVIVKLIEIVKNQ